MALVGPSGSGKTYTALRIARTLGDKVALIDTERGSAEKYAGSDEDSFEFDVCPLEDFSPSKYMAAIRAAEKAEYDVLIIDSLTHAWSGKGGALEMVNDANARQKSNNKWAAWRDVTPQHNALVDAILQSPMHIICTMRTKTEWIVDDSGGKAAPKKVGLAPVQRDGIDYEFDVVGDMDASHNLIIEKTRCKAIDGKLYKLPGEEFADILKQWLSIGKVVEPPPVFTTISYYNEDDAMPAIKDLISGNVLPWFETIGWGKATIQKALKMCADKFDVKTVDAIPEEKKDELRDYIKKTVVSAITKEKK